MNFFFFAFIIGLIAFAVQTACHIRCIYHGMPGNRVDHVSTRIRHVLRMSFGHHRISERWWGKVHVIIFYAFILFLFSTLELLIMTVAPGWRLSGWIGMNATGIFHVFLSYFAWMTLVAITVIIVRRLYRKNEVRSTFDAWFILGLIAILMVAHLGVMTARIALNDEPEWMKSFLPLCSWIGEHLNIDQAHLVHDLSAGIHILAIAVFLVWIPKGKHLHILFAFPNVFCQFRAWGDDKTPVTGADLPDIQAYESALESSIERDEPEEIWPVLGAIKVKELKRQFLLNAFSCTQCQRCTNACPMMAVKEEGCIGPMDSMIRLRALCLNSNAQLVGEPEKSLITPEELWHCTQCGACDRACPVGNSHATRIIDLRRGLVCREEYPPKINAVFSHLERSGNPWGYAKSERTKWVEKIKKSESNPKLPRILIFAGCMGAYDLKAQKTLVNGVNWLIEQGFEVRTLEKELCCGEPLRMLGKEDEFQKVMASNLSEIDKIPHDVILTVCPHCAQMLKNACATSEKRLNAMHLLEFVADLDVKGMLEIRVDEKVPERAVHVPCGLGKTPETPRRLLHLLEQLGLKFVDRDVTQSHCCGAGGGQFFMDNGRKITHLRVGELVSSHSGEIATACPFCMQMLGDEIVSMNAQDDSKDNLIQMVNVVDICCDGALGVHVAIKEDDLKASPDEY